MKYRVITEADLLAGRPPDPPYTQEMRDAVELFKTALQPRAIGAPVEESRCNCGAIHLRAGHVTEVLPPTGKYGAYQLAEWYLWAFKVETECGQVYSVCSSIIFDTDEFIAWHAQYFKPEWSE